MTRQALGGHQVQAVAERLTGLTEQVLKHPAHGEHRRPGVDALPGHGDLPHLPTRFLGALNHGYLAPGAGKVDRCGEPADARADNDGLRAVQAADPVAGAARQRRRWG